VVKASVNFEEIFTTLMDNLTQIETLAKSTKRMAENRTHVTGAIMAITAISEKTMASTEEVSATTEEQSAASQEVTSLADNLTGIASKLKESVKVFMI
jgi:methyl-accepting chemotaxis protein